MTPLEAAFELIDRHGPGGVSVRRLAPMTNYSRSGLAYRIGEMDVFHAEVARAIAASVSVAYLGDGPPNLRDAEWTRGAVTRTLDWIEANPNRYDYLCGPDRPASACEALDCALDDLLGSGRPAVPDGAAGYILASLRLLRELSTLMPTRQDVIAAMARHCDELWSNLAYAHGHSAESASAAQTRGQGKRRPVGSVGK